MDTIVQNENTLSIFFAGKDIHYYVPDSVYQYITEMNLYKK
jgi:nicotinic acid mononucleotide adenylyltransferase